jgi:hypothetical protein
MQSFSIDGGVITQSFAGLSDRSDVHGFAGMEDGGEDESLSERGLVVTGYEGMEMAYVTELDVSTILEVLSRSTGGSAELRTEDDTALIIKTIACLDENGIGTGEGFDITCVDAGDEFMFRVREHLARVYFIRWSLVIGDCYEGEEVADLIVGEGRDEAKFVERFEGMFVGVEEDVIYLTRGEEVELAQFFVGGVVEVNRGIVESEEIGLELLIIDFADFGGGIVDVQDDVLQRLCRHQ